MWRSIALGALSVSGLCACQGQVDPTSGAAPLPGASVAAPAQSSATTASPTAASATAGELAGNEPVEPNSVEFGCAEGQADSSPARIWRLSPRQLKHSLQHLFQDPELDFESPLQLSPTLAHFPNTAELYTMTELSAEQLFDLSEQLSQTYSAELAAIRPCLSQPAPDAACWSELADAFGQRAFRRPLDAEQRERMVQFAQSVQAELGKDEALRLLVETTIASPQLLFRSELGQGPADEHGRVRLTPYELASALSFTLTDRPPSDELLASATSGALQDPAAVRQQAALLASSEAARETKLRFFREYFEYSGATGVYKDPELYPHHDAERLVDDTEAFLHWVQTQGGDVLSLLLTSAQGFASAETAQSYGVEVTAEQPQLVNFPAAQRAGILTQPSFLAAFSHSEENDPIRRGIFVREHLLCKPVPELPINEVPPLPELGPDATLRETLQQHRDRPDCAACHQLMDSAGLGFESYDHTGRFRQMEKGRPVDATGELIAAGDASGPFDGAIELGQLLVGSETVRQCFVRHGFRYFMGRNEAPSDSCTLATVENAFEASGNQLDELVTSVMTSESFVYRKGVTQ